MSASLDLNLLPLNRQEGQEPGKPSLLMVTPPRRTARGRNKDLLILYLAVTGSAPLEERQQEQILTNLSRLYYKTPGSITFALKALADSLNQYLLDRNLRSSSSGRQGIGLLTLVVLKQDRLTLAHCGPMHAYLIKSGETQHLHDPQVAGRGLGIARSTSIRYYQYLLQPNDVLLVSPQPPTAWTPHNLQQVHGQALDSVRRRLMSQAGPSLNAVVIHAQAGSGKMRLLRAKPAAHMVQPMAVPGAGKIETASDRPLTETPDEPVVSISPPQQEAGVSRPVEEGSPVQEDLPEDDLDFLLPIEESGPSVEQSEALAPPAPVGVLPEVGETPGGKRKGAAPKTGVISKLRSASRKKTTRPKPARESGASLKKAVLVIGRAAAMTLQEFLKALATLLKRILPDESLFTIPASTMLFTAVAVAIVIAVAGAMVYDQRGRAAQYQVYFEQAVEAAQSAVEQQDPVEIRTAWETTIHYLKRADIYKTTGESQALWQQAQGALDGMDYIYRLSFQEAVAGDLGASANITMMAATNNEIYMYNATGGNVLRATRAGSGYDIDSNFICSENPVFGPLVDMVPLQRGSSSNASLMALDMNGNLMYCSSSEPPRTTTPAPPHSNWAAPAAFSLDNGHLYVLDPQTNGVWIYRNMEINQPPHLFFDQQVPHMADVIDIAVNRDDLYLLHQDGKVTTCKYSYLKESPTRCDDPAVFYDARPGRQNGPAILDAQFQQILYTPPPDPSIYMLDTVNQSVYHFSLRLNFQRQFRSLNSLSSETGTAFAVSPNRTLFLATGSRVYYSTLP